MQLGTQELNDLWNLTESNTSSLRAEDRGHLPTCQEFMEDVIEQLNPEEGIEDEYKRKNDKVLALPWRSGVFAAAGCEALVSGREDSLLVECGCSSSLSVRIPHRNMSARRLGWGCWQNSEIGGILGLFHCL